MKLAISYSGMFGYPYFVTEPDPTDPCEKIIEVSDDIGHRWLKANKEYESWQKEVNEFLEEIRFFKD